ncbi:MAG: hypothetical protein KDA75_11435 [Planctomycetaceae bacterium]|nr:hypothetical protein [Planctomycetaceae bacterium]
MTSEIYRYDFEEVVPTEEIEASLILAVWSCEALHGEAQVRLDAAHFLDVAERKCVIDANTAVGRDLNKLFVAFLRREYGEDAFQVRRVAKSPAVAA